MTEEKFSKKEIVLALIAAGQAIVIAAITYGVFSPKAPEDKPLSIASPQIADSHAPLVGFSYVSTSKRADRSEYSAYDCESDAFESAAENLLSEIQRVDVGVVSARREAIKIRFTCAASHNFIAISIAYPNTIENRESGRLILKGAEKSFLRKLALTKDQKQALRQAEAESAMGLADKIGDAAAAGDTEAGASDASAAAASAAAEAAATVAADK